MYFSCVQCLYVTFLTDVKLAQRKASRRLWFCLFVAKAWVSHVCVGHQLLSDRSQGESLFQFILLRHHYLGHVAVEDQFCSSTSRKQLEEENGGIPYSRSSGGSHETGHSCQSQWCCHVCFQLSPRGLPRHMDMRWPAVFVDQRKKSCGLCVCQ